MEKILEFLKELQLSDTEAKLYISLLEAGPSSVRDVALKIGLKRTTAYLYIENLMKKGLITKTVINSRSQISPIQPEEGLTTLVKDTIENSKLIEKKLPEVIEDIKTAFPTFNETEKFEIKHYNHRSGIRKIYEEAFKAKEFRSFVKLVDNANPIFEDSATVFQEALERNKDLHIKELIYEFSAISHAAQVVLEKNDRYTYKYMPKDMQLTSEDIIIYDGKVAIIHSKGKEYSHSVVLQSPEYYNNSVEFFDFIWNVVPDIQK